MATCYTSRPGCAPIPRHATEPSARRKRKAGRSSTPSAPVDVVADAKYTPRDVTPHCSRARRGLDDLRRQRADVRLFATGNAGGAGPHRNAAADAGAEAV